MSQQITSRPGSKAHPVLLTDRAKEEDREIDRRRRYERCGGGWRKRPHKPLV